MGKAKALLKATHPRFATGSDLLDLVVGGGEGMGYPAGRIINIVGDKSSGKTFLACEIIAASYFADQSVRWVYDDCESGFGFNTKKLYGIEIMPEQETERRRSETVEMLHGNIRQFLEGLKGSERGVYVVDSLDGLSSEEGEDRIEKRFAAFEKGKEFTEGSYQMGKAKFLSQEFFPSIAKLVEVKNALLIIISQVRTNIDPRSFQKWTRAGGKALDFYAHTVLWLTTMTTIKKKERAIGVVVLAETKKSKTPRPFRSCVIVLLFDYGLDNLGSNIDFLYDLRGDSGKQLKAAEIVVWGGGSMTIAAIQELVEAHDGEWTRFKKEVGSVFNKIDLIKWVETQPELAKEYAEHSGVEMSRNELITYIDSHGLEAKVTEKVIEKWERIECEIKTDRAPKYEKKRSTIDGE